MGTTLADFHIVGNIPVLYDCWNSNAKGKAKDKAQFFNRMFGNPSGPVAFCGDKLRKSERTVFLLKVGSPMLSTLGSGGGSAEGLVFECDAKNSFSVFAIWFGFDVMELSVDLIVSMGGVERGWSFLI